MRSLLRAKLRNDYHGYSTLPTLPTLPLNSPSSLGAVSLQDNGPRIGNPGAGGWPTVRYFNKETGVEGAAYQKKTAQAMCDELKTEHYMQGLIEEQGNVVHDTRPAPLAAAVEL